jgi:hypothetical protein
LFAFLPLKIFNGQRLYTVMISKVMNWYMHNDCVMINKIKLTVLSLLCCAWEPTELTHLITGSFYLLTLSSHFPCSSEVPFMKPKHPPFMKMKGTLPPNDPLRHHVSNAPLEYLSSFWISLYCHWQAMDQY